MGLRLGVVAAEFAAELVAELVAEEPAAERAVRFVAGEGGAGEGGAGKSRARIIDRRALREQRRLKSSWKMPVKI